MAPTSTRAPASISECLRAYDAGLAHFRARSFDDAQRCFEQCLTHKHDLAAAHFYLGLIFRERGELEDASDELLLATAFDPQLAEAWLYLGVLALQRKDYDGAANYYETALAVRPNYAEAYNGLGKIHEDREEFVEAAKWYELAIAASPRFALGYCNLAYVTLQQSLDSNRSMTYVRRALELDPTLADAHATKAMILQQDGRWQAAIDASHAALDLEPGLQRARMVRALGRLTLGNFEDGWLDYEARRDVTSLMQIRKFPYPEWDGSDLRGKSILVYYEQGIGDEIMFASCFPDLLATGARCYVECSATLQHLLRRSFPAITFVVADQTSPDMSYLRALPQFDWQLAAGSLPLHFRRQASDFPCHAGYLRADRARADHWRRRLDELGAGKKVGLSWFGGTRSTNRKRRSIPLTSFGPLLRTRGIQFASVQYADCHAEIDALAHDYGTRIAHWQDAIDDYSETAALVSALDLVISVQTAVIHLAGALATPVWILVPSTPEWRYMAHGDVMRWYPAARIFRQGEEEGWDLVLEQVSAALEQWRDQSGTG
jgi:tetratricopeptide (TPR) repeat protein